MHILINIYTIELHCYGKKKVLLFVKANEIKCKKLLQYNYVFQYLLHRLSGMTDFN